MEYRSTEILYKGILLQSIGSNKTIEEIQKHIQDQNSMMLKDITFSIADVFNNSGTLVIDIKEEYLIKYLTNFLGKPLNCTSINVIKYINMLEELYNNSDTIDEKIIKENKLSLINYTELISNRNLSISIPLLANVMKDKNNIVSYYLLRDLIENIKLYLYFIRGPIVEETIVFQNGGRALRELKNEKTKQDIIDKLSKENQNWSFDIKQIINNNPSLKIWSDELKRIETTNNICNAYIHKNGYSKLKAQVNPEINFLEEYFYITKFYFTLVVCYSGMNIHSSDYTDYLDFGEEPPDGSQTWIAPIFKRFIDEEYSSIEKAKLIEQSYMSIE